MRTSAASEAPEAAVARSDAPRVRRFWTEVKCEPIAPSRAGLRWRGKGV
jgi:hypothetical protein